MRGTQQRREWIFGCGGCFVIFLPTTSTATLLFHFPVRVAVCDLRAFCWEDCSSCSSASMPEPRALDVMVGSTLVKLSRPLVVLILIEQWLYPISPRPYLTSLHIV